MKAIIALGNKARNGKDSVATFATALLGEQGIDSVVIRWSDALYKEVKNAKREQPLIVKETTMNGTMFYLLDTNADQYKVYRVEELPQLAMIFQERKINEYWGMDEKDSPILQVWGTDFRRRFFGEDYWVIKALHEILDYRHNKKVIIIPDTRFINEYEAVKRLKGKYVNVVRLNEDGSRYIDPSRSSTHKSETELDETDPDFTIIAKSGEMESLKLGTRTMLQLFDLISGE